MATKWGIASAGKISNDFVAALQTLPSNEHEIIAVAARDLKSARSFAFNHGIPKSYGSYDELAKDQNVEVVYVGCVNSQHYPVGKLMLESGKHVLMEKPMTLSAKQTKALGEIARQNQCFLMEALWSRFLPSYEFLMHTVKRGSIGEVVHVDANLGFPILHSGSITRRDLGGGTILALGIYPLNVVSMIYSCEKPIEITAVGHLNEDGIDTSMTCSLKYSNNRTATVTTNGSAELPCDIVITGTKGRIKIPNSMYAAKTIETPEKTFEFPLPASKVPCNYPDSSGLKYEAMEVRKCIKNGSLESSLMPLKDSEMLAEVMDDIRRQLGVVYPGE